MTMRLNQADTLAGGRKDCVLHARIPPALDQALKQRARRLNIPVSRLIRDLLVDAMRHDSEVRQPYYAPDYK